MEAESETQVYSPYATIQSTLLFILVLGLYTYLLKREKKTTDLPPGPTGWPILGNLPSLTLHSESVFFAWNKQYGPVVRLKMVNINLILLGSVEAVQEAFVKKADVFSSRMQNSLPGMSGDDGIAFLNYTHKLKRQRRFSLVTLREFGMGRRRIEPIITEKCDKLCDLVDDFSDKNKPFALDFMIYGAVSGIISELLFNKDLPAENKDFRDFLHLLMTGTKYSALNGLLIFYPGLKNFPPFCWGHQEVMEMEKIPQRLLSEQVSLHKTTRNPKEPRDFIDCFLNEMDLVNQSSESEEEHGFHDDQLISTLRDLFYAGSETSSTAICWIVLYLSRKKEIQEKLYDEIREVLGENDELSMSVVDRMPYTRAVLQETCRLRPITPVGVPHVAAREDTIMGYRVPKGAVIASNLYRIHNDENIWENAEVFNPQRHIDSNGNFIKSPHIIPYSIGARQCLGLQLANMELFLVVVSLFRKFSFELVNPDAIDMRGENVFVLRPSPFKVTAKRR